MNCQLMPSVFVFQGFRHALDRATACIIVYILVDNFDEFLRVPIGVGLKRVYYFGNLLRSHNHARSRTYDLGLLGPL